MIKVLFSTVGVTPDPIIGSEIVSMNSVPREGEIVHLGKFGTGYLTVRRVSWYPFEDEDYDAYVVLGPSRRI